MTRLLIWYLPEDNVSAFNDEIEKHQFHFEVPKNREDFLSVLRNLQGEKILLHIFTHGGRDRINRIGTEREADDVMDLEGLTPEDTAVSYREINRILTQLRDAGSTVIVNMMAVCLSAFSNLEVDHFIGFAGLNKDQSESFEIYPLNFEQLPQKIIEINSRRPDTNEVYQYQTH